LKKKTEIKIEGNINIPSNGTPAYKHNIESHKSWSQVSSINLLVLAKAQTNLNNLKHPKHT